MRSILLRSTNHSFTRIASTLTCALILASCGKIIPKNEFNAKAKKAPLLSEQLAAPVLAMPVDRRLRVGGIPSRGAGPNNSANMHVVSHEVNVAGAQVGGKFSISN